MTSRSTSFLKGRDLRSELKEKDQCVIRWDWSLWLSPLYSEMLSSFGPVMFSSPYYFLTVSLNFYQCPCPSFLPSSWLGAALSGPPVSEFSRQDHTGIRNNVWLQSWRRASVDGELDSQSASESMLWLQKYSYYHSCKGSFLKTNG